MRVIALPLLFFVCVASLALSGCYSQLSSIKNDTVRRAALPVHMVPRLIKTDNFALQSYDRIHDWKGGSAKIYIEGETDNWITDRKLSFNPTPREPVGIKLASYDSAPNVIWIARPCQYQGLDDKSCENNDYWGSAQFAPEVIASYHQALDDIKQRYGISSFELVGYSGGGVIAALLAAERDDVTSLRTVATPLDHMAFTQIHKLESWNKSKNPIDQADRLATIPQRHFIGAQDQLVPPAIYTSYARSIGNDNCMSVTLVEDADHVRNWATKWPELLKEPAYCKTPSAEPLDPDVRDARKRAYQELIGPKK